MTQPLPLLARARLTLQALAPGFDAALAEIPFAQREAADSPALACFKSEGPVALLIPQAAGGLGASPLQAVQVQVALGARSPSVAVATTMHQFSVASLVALAQAGGGAEGLLMRAIAEQRLLLASGFSEGVPGSGILEPVMSAREADGGVYLSGSKKPCSLAASMDLLTASFTRPTPEGDELIVAMVTARTAGISRHPFWVNPALAAAQSDELRLQDVHVPGRMLFSAGLKHRLGHVQLLGFIWFELLMSASYAGACAGLVEQVVQRARWNAGDRVELACGLQLALSALEGMAAELGRHEAGLDDLLARLLLLRYELERLLARVSDLAHEMLGGASYFASTDASLWLLSCRGLRFHPPARISMAHSLAGYLSGDTFSMSKPSLPVSASAATAGARP